MFRQDINISILHHADGAGELKGPLVRQRGQALRHGDLAQTTNHNNNNNNNNNEYEYE